MTDDKTKIEDGMDVVDQSDTPKIDVEVPDGPLGTTDRWIPFLHLVCTIDGDWLLVANEIHDGELDTISVGARNGFETAWRARAGVGVPDKVAIQAFADDVLPAAAAFAKGRTIGFDGANMAGTLDEEATRAYETIQRMMDDLRWMRDDVAVMDAVLWAKDDLPGVMETIGYGTGPEDDAARQAMVEKLTEMATSTDCALVGVDDLFRVMAERLAENRVVRTAR